MAKKKPNPPPTPLPETAEQMLQALDRGEAAPAEIIADAFREAGMEDHAEKVMFAWRTFFWHGEDMVGTDLPAAGYKALGKNIRYWLQFAK